MQFKDIFGQGFTKEKLINTVKENRVSHAQLFLGPEGSGKLALALAYAQYISCTDKKADDSCGVCSSCIKYNKLIHPDLHFFFPSATTKKITKPASKCFSAEWREFVIKNNYYVALEDWFEYIGIENKQGIINAQDCNDIITVLCINNTLFILNTDIFEPILECNIIIIFNYKLSPLSREAFARRFGYFFCSCRREKEVEVGVN